MPKRNWIGWVGTAGLVAIAVSMAATNPDRAAYEKYATEQLSAYLRDSLCRDLPAELGNFLQEQCQTLVQNNPALIQELIRRNTQTQNFGLFSHYRTQFAVPGLVMMPSYEVDTVGIWNQFITYRAEQR